jgi:hypothetical protein
VIKLAANNKNDPNAIGIRTAGCLIRASIESNPKLRFTKTETNGSQAKSLAVTRGTVIADFTSFSAAEIRPDFVAKNFNPFASGAPVSLETRIKV